MSDLLNVLIKMEGSVEDAKNALKTMIEDVNDGADPEEVLYEYGLEPDYVMDLIEYL